MAAPHRQQPEGDDETRRHDGRGEQPDQQAAAGEAEAVEGPGESNADDKRQCGRQRRLQGCDVDEVAEIDA